MFCASPYFTVFFCLQHLLIIDYGKNGPNTVTLTHVSFEQSYEQFCCFYSSYWPNSHYSLKHQLISSLNTVSPSTLLGALLKLHKGLMLQQCYIGAAQIGLSGVWQKPVGSGSSTIFQVISRWSWDWQRRLRIGPIFHCNDDCYIFSRCVPIHCIWSIKCTIAVKGLRQQT